MKKTAILLTLAFALTPVFVMAHEQVNNDNDLYTLCHDGQDNDHDGYIDLLDSDCAQFRPVCPDGQHSNNVFVCVDNAPTDPVCVLPELLNPDTHLCVLPQDPTCLETQHLDNHVCVDNPPVVPTCSDSQTLVDNVCVDNATTTPPVVCGDNQTLVDNVCTDNATTTPPVEPPSDGGSGSNPPPVSHPSNGPIFGSMGGSFGSTGTPIIPPPVATSCAPLLTKYLRFGVSNDSGEVSKLEGFLGLTQDGFFSTDVENAVKTFQLAHADRILSPWNLTLPSGIVYKTTRKTINELYCATVHEDAGPLIPWSVFFHV